MIRETQIERLDQRLEHYNATLSRLAEFILPARISWPLRSRT